MNGFTFGNMNEMQTRNAITYINNGTLDSQTIAKRVSEYKGAKKVKTTTISHLRTYLSKHPR